MFFKGFLKDFWGAFSWQKVTATLAVLAIFFGVSFLGYQQGRLDGAERQAIALAYIEQVFEQADLDYVSFKRFEQSFGDASACQGLPDVFDEGLDFAPPEVGLALLSLQVISETQGAFVACGHGVSMMNLSGNTSLD